MRLNDSEDGRAGHKRAALPMVDDANPTPLRSWSDSSTTDPAAYVRAVADRLTDTPTAAADVVGSLLTVAREHEGSPRVAAGEALDAIGRRRPAAFDVWAADLAGMARSTDDELAFFGLRALAQLAAVDHTAAVRGLSAALSHVGSPDPALRKAALAVLAEVGPSEPTSVRRADRPLAEALEADDAEVRTAAAIAAGRLLGEIPNAFPRTATALLATLSDENERVNTYAHIAMANFARAKPVNVPQKAAVLSALADVTDDDLGLRRGAVGEAMTALVRVSFESHASTA